VRLALEALQGEAGALRQAVVAQDERGEATRVGLVQAQAALADMQQGTRVAIAVEVEAQLLACREELRREGADRRAEEGKLAARVQAGEERLELVEQQHIKNEGALRQEFLEVQASLKRESRDREAAEAKLGALVREEAARREEAVEREAGARRDGEGRLVDLFQADLREERRVRETAHIRLEDRSFGAGAGKPGMDKAQAGVMLDYRHMRQALAELQDRVGAAESRQKSAEERTVSMLDAIMSGLAGPGEH